MRSRIVVGVDGSPASAAALAWAASEARRRCAKLVACSVVDRRPVGRWSEPTAEPAADESTYGYPMTLLTPHGEAGVQLLAACEDADLLVVGSRGRGPLAGSLLGSVSRACLAHAPCPVVVLRQPEQPRSHGRVVVGVDGSGHSRRALRLAADEARLRGTTLEVLHAVFWDRIGTELMIPTPTQLLEWGRKLAAAELAATGVDGQQAVVHGRPGEVLVRRSEAADLLVLGMRTHNPAASLLLGSVSEHCVRHAQCPVMVTRAEHGRRSGDAPTPSLGGVRCHR